jgi:hypothetical protein
MRSRENWENLVAKSVCVCRGVLRFWGMRIQDSRTDFDGKSAIFIVRASMRGWCKILRLAEEYVDGDHYENQRRVIVNMGCVV